MRFAREIIPANSAKRRLAITSTSTIDIIERRCLIIIVRLLGHTAGARSDPDRPMSMISLEYWFHVNSSALPLILAFMLRCALLSVSVGTAFRILRDPGLCFPLGTGAGQTLIVGCSDKLRDSLAKNAWRSGWNIRQMVGCILILRSNWRAKPCDLPFRALQHR